MEPDKYRLAVIYANEGLTVKIGSINKISKVLKRIDKVNEVKVYTTEKFIGKTDEKFHKVIVLTDEPNPNFDLYRRSLDPEYGTEMLIVSESNEEQMLHMVDGLNYMVTTQYLILKSNWWPSVLRFLFRSEALDNEAKQNACLLLLNDGPPNALNVRDISWALHIKGALQMFGLKCVQPWQPEWVAIKEGRSERLRYQVILATKTGEAMLRKQQQDFGVNVGSYDKIICFTEEKRSNVCKTVKNFKDVDVKIIEIPQHIGTFRYKDWVVLLNEFKLLEMECSNDKENDVDVWKIVLIVALLFLLLPLVGALIFINICFGIDVFGILEVCGLTESLCFCACWDDNVVSHFDD